METATLGAWTKLQQELKDFVYRKVKDKADSEDIVQDVFLKVQANANQIKDAGKISSWIYAIARNAVADYHRNHAKVIRPVDVDWETDQQQFNECVGHCLRVFLATLPEKYRSVLELTDIGNLSQLEAAERLHISHSAARSRVQRARKMLYHKMNEVYVIQTDCYGNVLVCEDRDPGKPCTCSC